MSGKNEVKFRNHSCVSIETNRLNREKTTMIQFSKQFLSYTSFALVLGLGVSLSGCGGDNVSDPVEVEETSPALKSMLEGIAQSGTVGSTAMELEQVAGEKAELKADIEALIAADGKPAEVKKQATALLKKL